MLYKALRFQTPCSEVISENLVWSCLTPEDNHPQCTLKVIQKIAFPPPAKSDIRTEFVMSAFGVLRSNYVVSTAVTCIFSPG